MQSPFTDIGPYRVLRAIAAGGSAEVYEVEDPVSGDRLALKILLAVQTSLARFNREYEALTRLNHPGVVRVYHYGIHRGRPWLTMELLRGDPAQKFAKSIGPPGTQERTEQVMRLSIQLAHALRYMHRRKMVHRDLKSANVLVLPDRRVKLIDLGAASLADQPTITKPGEFIGTFAYASPEQLRGKRVTSKCDLYSFGVLLFRLLTGRRPFDGDTPEELANQHLSTVPPKPSDFVPDLPKGLDELVCGLLAKDPDDRPRTAGTIARTLERIWGRPFPSTTELAIHDRISVSREAELRRASDWLGQDPSRTLVVTGEDGLDRARFAQQVAARAESEGWRALDCPLHRATSWEDFMEMLAAWAELNKAGAVAEAHQAIGHREALSDPSNRSRVRHLVHTLAGMAGGSADKLVVQIQNAHRASAATRELLDVAFRSSSSVRGKLKLVLYARAPIDQDTPLPRLQLPDSTARIHLSRLAVRQVALALTNMLGRRPPPLSIARSIHGATFGRPAYVEQAIHALADSRLKDDENAQADWAGLAGSVDFSAAPRDRAGVLLKGLPLSWRRTLECMVVCGEDLSVGVVAELLGTDAANAQYLLRALAAEEFLLTRDEGNRFSARQPALLDVLKATIHPARQSTLMHRLARHARNREPTRWGVAALLETGDLEHAARHGLKTARQALIRHDATQALEIVRPLLAKVYPATKNATVADLFIVQSLALQRLRPTDTEGGQALAYATQIADETNDPALLARVKLCQARHYRAVGHFEASKKALRDVIDKAPADAPELRRQASIELTQNLRWRGDIHAASDVTDALLAEADATPASHNSAVIQHALNHLAQAKLERTESALTSVLTSHSDGADPRHRWHAVATWATCLRHQGRYSEALAQLHQATGEAAQQANVLPHVELLLATATIEYDLQRLGRAQDCLDEMRLLLGKGEHLRLRLEAQLLTGRVQLASGRLDDASWSLRQALMTAQNAGLHAIAELARTSLAETASERGELVESDTLFQSAILGLMAAGSQLALAEGCRIRARVKSTTTAPDALFSPVRALLKEQSMTLLRIDHLLARGEWHGARREHRLSQQAFRTCATVMNRLATRLSDTDRAALRIHPWAARIQAGLQNA